MLGCLCSSVHVFHFGSNHFTLKNLVVSARGEFFFVCFLLHPLDEFLWFARDGVRWTFPVGGSQSFKGRAPLLKDGRSLVNRNQRLGGGGIIRIKKSQCPRCPVRLQWSGKEQDRSARACIGSDGWHGGAGSAGHQDGIGEVQISFQEASFERGDRGGPKFHHSSRATSEGGGSKRASGGGTFVVRGTREFEKDVGQSRTKNRHRTSLHR